MLLMIQSPPLNGDRLGAINLSPLSEVPFNRWKVLPYYRHSKGCTTACVIDLVATVVPINKYNRNNNRVHKAYLVALKIILKFENTRACIFVMNRNCLIEGITPQGFYKHVLSVITNTTRGCWWCYSTPLSTLKYSMNPPKQLY